MSPADTFIFLCETAKNEFAFTRQDIQGTGRQRTLCLIRVAIVAAMSKAHPTYPQADLARLIYRDRCTVSYMLGLHRTYQETKDSYYKAIWAVMSAGVAEDTVSLSTVLRYQAVVSAARDVIKASEQADESVMDDAVENLKLALNSLPNPKPIDAAPKP